MIHWKIISSSLQRRKNDMAHLLKLELKKFGVMRNIIFTFAAILFSIFFLTVSLVDSMTDPQQTKDSFDSTFLVTGLLIMMIFLVYASVLTAHTVIAEYNQKTITIMFSYPVNRRQLIAAKLILIMVYTALSMAAAYLCCCGYIIAADKAFDMLDGTFQPVFLQTWIPSAAISIIICTVLSLWPFIIGMVRKSVPAAIITSLLTIFLRQLMISKNSTYQESLLQVCLVTGITAVFTFHAFKKNVPQIY
ncbi:ABC transporter permease [Eisenbergiella massiliensis]